MDCENATPRGARFTSQWPPEVSRDHQQRSEKRAQKTREDGVFTLKLDEGVSLAMLVSFAQDMFPGVSTEDIGVWPADDGELVVSVRGGGALAAN